MTISSWDLYWITRLDDIKSVLTLGSLLGIFVLIVCMVAIGALIADEVPQRSRKLIYFLIPSWLFFHLVLIIGSILTPTTKEAAFIVITPVVWNSDLVQKEIPNESKELYSLAKDWLKEQVKNTDVKKVTTTVVEEIKKQ